MNLRKGLLALYVVLVFCVLPLLSPLRALGVADPGVLRNFLYPPLLFLFIFTFGLVYIAKPRTYFHLLFLFTIALAMSMGFFNLNDSDSVRAYFSHIFQIFSAYVMIGVGWNLYNKLSDVFWTRLVYMSLFAALISTVVTIKALGDGDVGRFYTPAYGFILTFSFGLVASKKSNLASFFGAIISNKRGVLLSILITLFAYMLARMKAKGVSKKKLIQGVLASVLTVLVMVFGSIIIVNWAGSKANSETAFGQAVNISYGRIESLLLSSDDKTIDQLSSGRYTEINAAISDLEGIDYVLGSGAGWGIELPGGKEAQNIHFSPLSIVAVFGAPIAVFLYGMLFFLVVRGLFRKDSYGLTLTEKMAPLYLCGAVVHSFTAYSLFIDWMVFFFVGVLTHSLKSTRGRHQTLS